MKKLLYIILISGFILSSCQDYLNIKPQNIKSLATLNDIKDAVSSFRYGLTAKRTGWSAPNLNFNQQYLYFPLSVELTTNLMFYSDNLEYSEVQKAQVAWSSYKSEYFKSNDWKNIELSNIIWDNCYKNIGFCNTLLDELYKISNKKTDSYKEVFCEIITFRAYMYQMLARFFCPNEGKEYGLPISTSSEQMEGVERSSQLETYKFIIDELKSVEKLNFYASEWNTFYSKKILKAILAKTYWLKAHSCAKETNDWNICLNYSKSVLESRSLLNNKNDLNELFSGGTSTGIEKNNAYALLIIRNKQNNKGNIYAPWGFDKDLSPNSKLLSLFDSEDIRKDVYFTSTQGINKWKQNFDVFNICPLWRIAEYKLLEAESYLEIGQTANAQKSLNEFKASRIKNYSNKTFSNLKEEIYKERRKEFCFELGYRWTDLKVLGKGFSRVAIIENTSSSGNEKGTFTLEDNDYRFTLPLPANSELKFNKQISQNPSWTVL